MSSEATTFSDPPTIPSSPMSPAKSKKRKGDKLEAPKKKKQKTKGKTVVKTNYQLSQAIEKKTSFELYSSYSRINLADSLIGPVGAKLLGDALHGSLIFELCLAGNHLPSRSMAPILSALPTLTMLESMDLSGNKLSDTDAKLIWEYMANNQTLTKLDLSSNVISLNGEWVSEPLKKCKLGQLLLNNNSVGDSGVANIAEGLLENNFLERLELRDNKISNLSDVASLLKSNTTLTLLDLSDNAIASEYDPLYNALKRNKTLIELNLQNVGLSLATLSGLVDVLRDNTVLRFMRVAKNGLPAELVKAFRQLLRTRRELRVVNGLANGSEFVTNILTEEEEVETDEQYEEDACTMDLCEWPDYEQVKPHKYDDATEIFALHPEVCIDVIVKKELDTHKMKEFYDRAMEKLSAKLSALEDESRANETVLSNMASPLREKEVLLIQLEEKKQKLELQIQLLKQEYDQGQHEYLKKKIPAMLTEDILSAAKVNAELVANRQSAITAQFESQQAKMQQPLIEWSVDDVAMLLKELNIEKYMDKFSSNVIAGNVLVNLNTSDLMQDLTMEWKDTKRLQKAIFLLSNQRSIYENPPGVFHWTTDDTCQWLMSVGFDKYLDVFKAHKVTGHELLLIDKYDLSNVFKIESLVDKVALERAIKGLVLNDDPSWKRDPSVVVIKQQPIKKEKQEPTPTDSSVTPAFSFINELRDAMI